MVILRLFLKFLAVFFPWLALLLCDNPGGAVIALVMQVTLIGWPFASSWAWKEVNKMYPKHKSVPPDEPSGDADA
ncbi:MAG: hypothetical protein JJT82_01050 [Legionellaceae bacterium]|nr:hypothetical protein [Legionellaceae bacterium]